MASRFLIFLLRPFVRPIRYLALKFMKNFGPPNDGRRIIAGADHLLDEYILPSVFDTFKDEGFRELANFRKLPVSEHDRIFNELEVAGVCLTLFHIETVKPFMAPDDFSFWRDVEERLTKQLQRKLIGLGVDGANAKLVCELIEMRYKEYDGLAELAHNMTNLENKDFKELPPEKKRLASVIQGTAIGTADHIRRGKIIEGDPLIKYLIGWFLQLDNQITKFINSL